MKSRVFLLLLVLVGVIACATVLRPAIDRAVFVFRLSIDEPPARLANPVKARTRLVNTWDAPRDGGRRRHQGIDIFAPRSTPVISTTRGIVTRVGTSELGGQVVWVLGPGLESHYYAHLDRFADIEPGDIVQPGDVLGYVGRTGNARGTPFHLHYGIYRYGGAKNPYPRLRSQP
jgi:murein DD-endopeptidase MepM/ murein hydrolase activator NlpD